MVNEKYFLSKLFKIRRSETAIRQEFDCALVMLVQNHARGRPVSEIANELNEQRKLRVEMLKHPYRLYLELKEEAETAAPQLVDSITALADQVGDEIARYA
ncbi:Uncharacterised protein [uncultured archaeon]|nr:Uncharacterised protein [uncultured archaeon]